MGTSVDLSYPYESTFSPDGSMLVTHGDAERKGARLFRTGDWRVARALPITVAFGVVFSPDSRLVAGIADQRLAVVDAQTGREVGSKASHVLVKAFSADGSLLAVVERGTVEIVESQSGRVLAQVSDQFADSLVFSSDGRLAATMSNNKTDGSSYSQVFESRTGRILSRLSFAEPMLQAAFTPDGRMLRVATGGKRLRISKNLIDASLLAADACGRLQRNLTNEEWRLFVGDTRRRETCAQAVAKKGK
jgi:WD40 repeat protein